MSTKEGFIVYFSTQTCIKKEKKVSSSLSEKPNPDLSFGFEEMKENPLLTKIKGVFVK